MFSGVFICTLMQPVFSKIKDPEEHNNNGVNPCGIVEDKSPRSTLYSLHCSFLGIRAACLLSAFYNTVPAEMHTT